MNPSRKPTGARLQRIALLVSAPILCLLLVFTIRNSPPPAIDLRYGDTTIQFAADRAWTLFQGDCVNIQWQLEGIQSLHIDGHGEIGWGEMSYCPSINATSPLLEVTAINGIYRRLSIDIQHLPDLLFYLAGFVGLIGSVLLAIYFLRVHQLERPLPVTWLVVGGMLLAVAGSWLRLTPYEPPLVDVDDGDVAVRLWAEHDRTLFPHECVDVRWSVVGAELLHFNGKDVSHNQRVGITGHCAEDGERATLDVMTENGEHYSHQLSIPSLFTGKRSPPEFFIVSLFGVFLGGLVFVPLGVQAVSDRWRRKAWGDFAAVGGFIFLVAMLYLPFGFGSSGHWEEWVVNTYFEGKLSPFIGPEFVSRFFALVPHTVAYILASESFVGYHLVHYVMLSGKMAILYGIMRQLKISPLYAFLTATLFMAYPVNSSLMSLRSFPMNFSMLSLLAAVSLMLDYQRNPRRLTLLGIWLGLLFNVGSNESGYAVILVVPLVWWLRDRVPSWRNLKLTVKWYIVPTFKLAFLLLLAVSNRSFYQGPGLNAGADPQDAALGIPGIFIRVMGEVFGNTFPDGWREALFTLNSNEWWFATMISLIGIGGIAWHLSHTRPRTVVPSLRQIALWLLGGLFFIIPAVGVLMWIPFYRGDLWRLYFYVPIGAAIAILGASLVITAPIRRAQYRQIAIIAVFLLLLLPSYSRLFAQHAHFVNSSINKARVLRMVMDLAPEMEPWAQLMIMTDFDHTELKALGIHELIRNDVLTDMFYVIYEGQSVESSYMCLQDRGCGEHSGGPSLFLSRAPATLLQRTLVFKLKEDLSVELIQDPASYLGLDFDAPYDASLLYNADAPLPSRASSMLGAALRD